MANARPDDTPLPSVEEEKELEESPDEEETETEEETAPPPRPPAPAFKVSTFVLTFLFLLGILMLFDTGARNGIATLLGTASNPTLLYWLIGFHGQYLLLSMFLAGAVEMIITAVAYNYTTDWVKAAKVQTWSSAFRKVQMAAMRSGKKDRMEALKPHQAELSKLSMEVSIAQLKGMAVTYFLLIVIYTWVGLLIAGVCPGAPNNVCLANTVVLGGASVSLMGKIAGYLPYWFLIFSLYTVPLSLIFRRILKNYTLRKFEARTLAPVPEAGSAGGTA